MNKTLSVILLSTLAFQVQAVETDDKCSTDSKGASCSILANAGNGYSKKISNDIEQFLINNGKSTELSNISTLIYYYTLPSTDGKTPNSNLTIKGTKIELPLDQNGGGLGNIRQNVIGPYSHLKLIATSPKGGGEINGVRIGIGASGVGPLELNLKNQYLQSGSLEISIPKNTATDTSNEALKFNGLIYMGNASKLSVDSDKPIEFNAKMQNSITYPKTKYYVGDEFDNDSFASNFYYDSTPRTNPNETSSIGKNLNLNFTASSFLNKGQLYISGAASIANIKLSDSGNNAFSNGSFTPNPNYIEHHSATMIDALNNAPDSTNENKPFIEQLNYKEGRISVFDYATLNITGNVHNDIYGNILLVDGGVLNIIGDFKNNGWLMSGAINTKDFGYINANGKSTLGSDTQIALITAPNRILLGNTAHLLLKSEGGISFENKPLDKTHIHLFNATKNNGALTNVSDAYLNTNLIFDTTLSNDNKAFYVTLRPTQEAKAKSVEELIKEANMQTSLQEQFQKNQEQVWQKKIALQKLLEQESINTQKINQYKMIAQAEFMNQKLQELQQSLDNQKQELQKLKGAYDAANVAQTEELKGVPFKDQAGIRKKWSANPNIKAYRDLESKINNQEYVLQDIKDALPQNATQEAKITQLQDIKDKYEASNDFNPTLLSNIDTASKGYVNALENAMRGSVEGLEFFATKDDIDKLRSEYVAKENKKYATFDDFIKARGENHIQELAQSLGIHDEKKLQDITKNFYTTIQTQYEKFNNIVRDYREKGNLYREEKTQKQAQLSNNQKSAKADFDAIATKIQLASPEIKNLETQINQEQAKLDTNTEYKNLQEQIKKVEHYSDDWYELYDKIEGLESNIKTLKYQLNRKKITATSKKLKPEDILSMDENTLKDYAQNLSQPSQEGETPTIITTEQIKAYAQAYLDAKLALSGDYKNGIKSGGTLLNEELQRKLSSLGKDTIVKLEEIVAIIEEIRNQKETFINKVLNAANDDPSRKRKMDILNGIKNLSDEFATSIIAHIKDEATLQGMVDTVEKNMDDLSTHNKRQSVSKTLNLMSSTLVQNRLALQTNPFNPNNSIAKAIKKLSKQRYAIDDNIQIDAFDALQEPFAQEEEQNMDIWATLIGAYGEANGNSIVYGASAGYDAMIGDSLIVGVFGTYAYAKSSHQGSITAKSHNAQISAYSRFFSNHHEFDGSISHNIGFINQDRKMDILNVSSMQTSDSINQTTSASISYGYTFEIKEDSNFYIKPLIGLGVAYAILGNYKEKGLKFEQKGSGNLSLDANIALEFRKYFKNGGYFYIIPGIDYLAYNTQKTIAYKLGGVEIISPLNQNNKIYYTALAGGEFKITESIFGFGSFGAKIASDEQYYNGSLGMRYKF